MKRRTFIASLATPFLVGCATTSGTVFQNSAGDFDELREEFRETGRVEGLSLRQVRQQRGIDIGATLPHTFHAYGRSMPEGAWNTVQNEFSLATPEINLEWWEEWRYPENQRDIVRLANSGKKIRGHNLYFYLWLPDPVKQMAQDGSVSAGQLGDYIYEKASARVRRWGNQVSYWSINETMNFGGGPGLRIDPVTRKLGMDTFRILVAAVKDSYPNKPVELNDFAVERSGTQMDRHVVNVVDYLDNYGLSIDRVGYQCHIDWRGGRKDFSAAAVVSSAQRMQRLGLDIAITEIDVDDRGFSGDAPGRDEFVARSLYNELMRLREVPSLVEVSTWSPFDIDNWIRRNDKTSPGFSDARSAQSKCGWFDENYNRKLSYYAVCKALS
ncbi:MAG: endo-1,4-beta-xylanase [Pseudomonadota bacterium]